MLDLGVDVPVPCELPEKSESDPLQRNLPAGGPDCIPAYVSENKGVQQVALSCIARPPQREPFVMVLQNQLELAKMSAITRR